MDAHSAENEAVRNVPDRRGKFCLEKGVLHQEKIGECHGQNRSLSSYVDILNPSSIESDLIGKQAFSKGAELEGGPSGERPQCDWRL